MAGLIWGSNWKGRATRTSGVSSSRRGTRLALVQADLPPLLLRASFKVVVVEVFWRFRVVPMMRRGFFGRLHHVVKRWLIVIIGHVLPLPVLSLTRSADVPGAKWPSRTAGTPADVARPG